MYCAGCGYGGGFSSPMDIPIMPNPATFNPDQGYFRPLEYRVSAPFHSYRSEPYISLFESVVHRPAYIGGSPIESYLSRNSIRMQVSLEYMAAGPSSYAGHAQMYYAPSSTGTILHDPEVFLSPSRPSAEFVENITPLLRKKIELVFRLVTGSEIPSDILISILSAENMRLEHAKHSRFWSEGILGFAINRRHLYDVSSVFIKSNPLDMLMLTIGHEIGHCLTYSLEDPVLEEAKAFAFELAWMKAICKHDILGLSRHMNTDLLKPAENGLHNVALSLVRQNLRDKEPLQVFRDIAAGRIASWQ